LNFGLSPNFSVQLKVSISDRLSQKLKRPHAPVCLKLKSLAFGYS